MKSIFIGLLIVLFQLNALSVFAFNADSEPDRKSYLVVVDVESDLEFVEFYAKLSDQLSAEFDNSPLFNINYSTKSAVFMQNETRSRLGKIFRRSDKTFWHKLKKRVGYDLISELKQMLNTFNRNNDHKP